MEHKTTKENLEGMSLKNKISHIWYYYRFHIIGSVVVIAMIASFISTSINAKIPVLNITLLGRYSDSTKVEILQNKATLKLVNDPKNKKEIRFDFLMKSNDPADQQFTMAAIQKLMASVAATDIDILILDKEDFEIYAAQGMFSPLSVIPRFSDLPLSGYEIIKFKSEEKKIPEDSYGIAVDTLPLLKQISYDTKDKVLCVVSNSKKLSILPDFLGWFFTESSLE